MAKKVIKVGDCKFILLKWRDKWVFPLISYYLSGKDSPIYFALFSWNLKEGKFVKETTVTINFRVFITKPLVLMKIYATYKIEFWIRGGT